MGGRARWGKIVSCDAGHRGDRYRPRHGAAVESPAMAIERRGCILRSNRWPGAMLAGILVVAIGGHPVAAQRGGRGGPPPSPRGAAPIDLSGQWVSLITEEWRQRQFTAPKGDFGSLNVVLLPPARKFAA